MRTLIFAIASVLALATGCTVHPSYTNEDALKQDLYILRNAVDQFTQDKGQAPQSLDDLVRAGYIREIPIDPIEEMRAWDIDWEDSRKAADRTRPGISDVHSRSKKISSEGTPYNSW